jgi:pimeloyl-ACP methyl ester carboxylesterase
MTYTSEFRTVNGVDLHFLHWRSRRPPLVILHGNGHCGGVYAPLGEALAPDFDVYAVDLRGHGSSSKAESYSWDDLRDDVLGLIDALQLEKVLFASHSRGGGVSLLAAAKAPDRVRAAVVYEPTVPFWGFARGAPGSGPPSRGPRMAWGVLERRSTFPDRQEMYRHFKGRGLFKDWRDDFLRAYVEYGSLEKEDGTLELACPPAVEAMLYEAAADTSEWEKISDCPVPVLAIYGERGGRIGEGRDPVAPIRRMFPRCVSLVMPDATHSGPMEHPEAFERAIREFATQIP